MRKVNTHMIKPRDKQPDPERPTFRLPKPEQNFGGWGPKLG